MLLDAFLQHLRDQGLVKARGRQRTNSTHVLAAVRWLNRLEHVGEDLTRGIEPARRGCTGLAASPGAVALVNVTTATWSTIACQKPRIRLIAAVDADGDQPLVAIAPQ